MCARHRWLTFCTASWWSCSCCFASLSAFASWNGQIQEVDNTRYNSDYHAAKVTTSGSSKVFRKIPHKTYKSHWYRQRKASVKEVVILSSERNAAVDRVKIRPVDVPICVFSRNQTKLFISPNTSIVVWMTTDPTRTHRHMHTHAGNGRR